MSKSKTDYKTHFKFKMPHQSYLSLESKGNGYKHPRRYKLTVGSKAPIGQYFEDVEFSYNDLMRLNMAIHEILTTNQNEHSFVKWFNNKATRAVARAKPKLKRVK